MKILVTESQYNRVISESDYFSKLSVEGMEEKMKLFFTSAEDYKRNLGMFIRLYFHLDLDNIKFEWNPQLNNESYARFQLKCYFPMDSCWLCITACSFILIGSIFGVLIYINWLRIYYA